MVKFKVLIGDKGKTYTKEVSDDQSSPLIGLKVGSVFKGDLIGLGGYELQITGGSDSGGFPMRMGLHGSSTRRLLLSPGVGFNSNVKGIKEKKRVAGDNVSEKTSQINTKIIKAGPTPLEKLVAVEEKPAEGEEAPKETAPAEAPKEKAKEEKKEEKPAEEKPAKEAAKEETPKKEKVEEQKPEPPKAEEPKAEGKPPEEPPAEKKPEEKTE